MRTLVKDLAIPLAEFVVVQEDDTLRDALHALRTAHHGLPPGSQSQRVVLVQNAAGEVVGKMHHFAFFRALLPERETRTARRWTDRAGVDDDLLQESMQMLDFLTGEAVDIRERARSVRMREIMRPADVSVDEDRPLAYAASCFLRHDTLSLLVTRAGHVVGLLTVSDVFDALCSEILEDAPHHV